MFHTLPARGWINSEGPVVGMHRENLPPYPFKQRMFPPGAGPTVP